MPAEQASFLHSLTQPTKESRPKAPEQPPADDVSKQLRELTRRIRILEERNTTLRKNQQVTEQNMLAENKKITTDVKAFSAELDELRKELNDIKEHIRILGRQMQETAKSEEVKVLEKYINLWEPLNFVTRNEVEKIIKELLKKHENPEKEVNI